MHINEEMSMPIHIQPIYKCLWVFGISVISHFVYEVSCSPWFLFYDSGRLCTLRRSTSLKNFKRQANFAMFFQVFAMNVQTISSNTLFAILQMIDKEKALIIWFD